MRGFLILFLSLLVLPPLAHASELATKVGQFFLFGLTDRDSITLETERHLALTRPGGFILFRRNMSSNHQVHKLIYDLQRRALKYSGTPAFMALDQEGGLVVRIPFDPPMPSPWAVAQTGDPTLAYQLGELTGKGLAELGFNMNLAPVLDLGSQENYSFLGVRTYSDRIDRIASMGVAFAKGLMESKIIPVAKHFPGLGPVANDPHKTLVRRTISLDSLWRQELPPFVEFSKKTHSGVMISHFVYPTIDPSLTPGTFSKPLITGLLRGTLGYQGLVVTDDLMMEGAQANKDFQENVVQAFEAGADVIMVSWSRRRQKLATSALIKAVRSGRISMAEIDSRLQRIQQIKKALPAVQTPSPKLSKKELVAPRDPAYRLVVQAILRKNIETQLDVVNAARAERYCLLPAQRNLGLGIFQGLQRTVPLSLASPELMEDFDSFCDDKGSLLVFVKSPRDVQAVRQLPSAHRKKTLVINQMRPSLFGEGFPLEIQIFSEDRSVPGLIAEHLRPAAKAAQPGPSEHVMPGSRSGLDPIERRPTTGSAASPEPLSGPLEPAPDQSDRVPSPVQPEL